MEQSSPAVPLIRSTNLQRTVIRAGLFLTVHLFVVLIDPWPFCANGVALAVPLPQQRTITQRPCTGFLCEYMQLNNEIAAAQGDMEKLAELTRRLGELRNRNAEERRRAEEERNRREQEERRRNEERRQREEERQREWDRLDNERRSQEDSKKRGQTWLTIGLCVGGVLLFVGCCWFCAKVCNDENPAGAGGEGYQMDDADDGGSGHTPGGFIFPPGPTTATYAFTPDGGQPCTFTPLGVGEPIQWAATPRPSPQFRPREDGNVTSNGAPTAAAPSPSAPPPDYHEAVNYPPYEEEDPKPGLRKKRIPGPT